ncbi:isoprenylcysteine carboxylmethyltransferase family protein [Phenylobacterium sp.]|uniref:methyltransferase family protein n=1 Tax=Phenylobacterium sp. TaxID=1871053 RepID=UPI002737151A|nr:isoprenylcysteine carboxylmethyltransferase family protein [Phenylobacterium sp.]MDP3854651.1 isoprenylcysteine carboxylmethyltransferase family protein [Phenylobacterium sp.]
MTAKLFLQETVLLVLMAVALFASAGTLDWLAAWVLLAEFGVLSLAIGLWLRVHDPALLAERMSRPVQENQQPWDRLFVACLALGFFGWLALAGLDWRFEWSDVPDGARAVGAAAVAGAFVMAWLTFRENSYAAAVVKVQEGQTVVDTGPYRLVRHPLYVGAMLFFAGASLMLESWWALAGGMLLTLLVAVRAVGEEHVLRRELPGYEEYAARVRYRLVPGVW